MRKENWFVIILIILGIILVVVPNSLGLIESISSLVTQIVATLEVLIIGSAIGLFINRRRKRAEGERKEEQVIVTVDPAFAHLTIHYSRKTDTPDTPVPARPRYISNSKTNQAYWISDLIEPHIKQHKISWHTYDSQKPLRAWFERNNITVNERDPSPEELGLSLGKDGSPLPSIVSKLKGCKLDDLNIAFLFPFRYHFRRSRNAYESFKRLLIKYSTMQAFDAPLHSAELAREEIITFDNYIMRPLESREGWSKRHHYTYVPRRYTDSMLEEDAERARARRS